MGYEGAAFKSRSKNILAVLVVLRTMAATSTATVRFWIIIQLLHVVDDLHGVLDVAGDQVTQVPDGLVQIPLIVLGCHEREVHNLKAEGSSSIANAWPCFVLKVSANSRARARGAHRSRRSAPSPTPAPAVWPARAAPAPASPVL